MSKSIEVIVYLNSTLVRFSPDGKSRKFAVRLPAASTIQVLVNELEITGLIDRLLFGLNGEAVGESARLHEGDEVHIMLPVSGG